MSLNVEVVLECYDWMFDVLSEFPLGESLTLSRDKKILNIGLETDPGDANIQWIVDELVTLLNGAFRVHEQLIQSPKITRGRITVRRNGSVGEMITAKGFIRNPLTAPEYGVAQILNKADSSPLVRSLLTLLSSDNGIWVKGQNIIDTIMHYDLEIIKAVEADPKFHGASGRLVATASNYKTLLADARHGEMGKRAHSDPMALADATAYLNALIQAAILSEQSK